MYKFRSSALKSSALPPGPIWICVHTIFTCVSSSIVQYILSQFWERKNKIFPHPYLHYCSDFYSLLFIGQHICYKFGKLDIRWHDLLLCTLCPPASESGHWFRFRHITLQLSFHQFWNMHHILVIFLVKGSSWNHQGGRQNTYMDN